MKIKPSKRPKKRYIVFEIISQNFNDSAIHKAIKKSVLNVLGNEYQKTGIRFLEDKYKPKIHRGIIRVNNRFTTKLIETLNKNKHIKTIGTSGILRKAEKKYLKIAS